MTCQCEGLGEERQINTLLKSVQSTLILGLRSVLNFTSTEGLDGKGWDGRRDETVGCVVYVTNNVRDTEVSGQGRWILERGGVEVDRRKQPIKFRPSQRRKGRWEGNGAEVKMGSRGR